MSGEFGLAGVSLILVLAAVLLFRSDRIHPNHRFIFKLLEGWKDTPLSQSEAEEGATRKPPAAGPLL